MTAPYIDNFYDRSPEGIARAEEKWKLFRRNTKYLGDDRSEYLKAVFGPASPVEVMAYLSNLMLSTLLTPGKRNRIVGQDNATGDPYDTFRCEVELPTLEYTALLLLKFIQFGEPDISSYSAMTGPRGRDFSQVISDNVYNMRAISLDADTVLRGVKILCAVAALKPELYTGLKKIYDEMDKQLLRNTLLVSQEMFKLNIATGTAAIPLFTSSRQVNFEAIEDFAKKITAAAYVILDCLTGSLEDFFNALLALDIENITTYKEENTMLVVTEILKNLVNKGVLITNNGRLMSIMINADDSVNIEPYTGNVNERPLITKLMVRNGDREEEIFSLQDAGLERIVNHAQNILNGTNSASTAAPRNITATPQAGQMRRNADGTISVRRQIGNVSMWAPASEEETAVFLAHENATANTINMNNDYGNYDDDNDEDTDDYDEYTLAAAESPNDVVICAVTENNTVRMARITRAEAEDQGLAILSVVERRD
jgi:hypothetical protein